MEGVDSGDRFTVSIEGEGVSVKKTISNEVARQLIAVVMGGSPVGSVAAAGSAGIVPSVLAAPVVPSGRRVSLREFLVECQAKRNPDKIAAMAAYLEIHEGTNAFTRDDIKGRFRLAGEAAPGNYGRDFTWAVTNGWIAEDIKAPGSYYVTQTGHSAVKSKFLGDVKKGTAQPQGRRRIKRPIHVAEANDE